MEVKNNKMLFNSKKWFKFVPLIFNSVIRLIINEYKYMFTL